jgi:hypothetical protein
LISFIAIFFDYGFFFVFISSPSPSFRRHAAGGSPLSHIHFRCRRRGFRLPSHITFSLTAAIDAASIRHYAFHCRHAAITAISAAVGHCISITSVAVRDESFSPEGFHYVR